MALRETTYRIDISRADLLTLVEAIMCATTQEMPGIEEAAQMRELGLRLQRLLAEVRPLDRVWRADAGRRDTPVPR